MNQYSQDESAKAEAKQASDLNLLHLLENRITEIVALEKEVKTKYPKLFYQKLPRFMRRRAASHNIKRIPKSRRPKNLAQAKNRKRVLAGQRKKIFLKHKRVLRQHQRHVYKDKNKTVLHKWFAKRFKIERTKPGLEQVPMYNNTKNQRNLHRQTLYGCAYLSMAHMIAVQVNSPYNRSTIDKLNLLTDSTSGFTFAARSLENCRYEVMIHLFSPSSTSTQCKSKAKKFKQTVSTGTRDYICPCLVTNRNTHLILWLPRDNVDKVIDSYQKNSDLSLTRIPLCDLVRTRLIGPDAVKYAESIVEDKSEFKSAILDMERRLAPIKELELSIGRFFEQETAQFTLFPFDPYVVDVVFCKKGGRMAWHNLVKNRAHLVGGKRDCDVLMAELDLEMKPDNSKPVTSNKSKNKSSKRRRGKKRNKNNVSKSIHKSDNKSSNQGQNGRQSDKTVAVIG